MKCKRFQQAKFANRHAPQTNELHWAAIIAIAAEIRNSSYHEECRNYLFTNLLTRLL